MYTSNEGFNEFFPDDAITSDVEYANLEEIAIIYLKESCDVFPSEVQWTILSEPYKGFLTKAIYYQIKHINDNQEAFFETSTEGVKSFSLGRFSVSEQSDPNSEVGEYSKLALKYLHESGLCSRDIETGCGCGCN